MAAETSRTERAQTSPTAPGGAGAGGAGPAGTGAALGLADWVVGLTYAGIWGLSTMVSPFSGTTLFMARITGIPAHIIGWRWMLPMVLLNGAVVAAMVIAIRHLLG